MDFGGLVTPVQPQAARLDGPVAPKAIELPSGADVKAFEQAYLPPVSGTQTAGQIDGHYKAALPTPQELLRQVIHSTLQSGAQAGDRYRRFISAPPGDGKSGLVTPLVEARAALEDLHRWAFSTQLMVQTTNKTAKFVETLIKGQ